MEFEVTATRKRPKALAEMVGQDFVVATLSNALATGQTAPAYLFSGPRGTGKTSTARILARSLNCEKGPTPEPCGVCPSCVEISKGSSPDVIEIDGASNTSVNDVREIKDEVLYAPQSSPKKIYIIDEVHMLSNSAFNALLKTIEEPPPYIVFVFATTEVHKVPATIRSRCQQFRFRLFSPELIKDKLVEAAGEMGRDFENDALFWIAREAAGSMRDAYTLFDQVLSFSEEKITLEGIRDKMGLVGLETASELMDAAAAGNRQLALKLLDELITSGTAVEQILVELADFIRNLILMAYGIEKESLLGVSADRFPEGPRRSWDIPRLEAAAEDAFGLFRDIRYSLNPRYELELFVGRLCGLSDKLDASDVLARIHALRNELSTGTWSEGSAEDLDKKKRAEFGQLSEKASTETRSAPAAPVVSDPRPESEDSGEAERFFARFGSGSPPKTAGVSKGPESMPAVDTEPPTAPAARSEYGQPDCAVPVDIGTGPSDEEWRPELHSVPSGAAASQSIGEPTDPNSEDPDAGEADDFGSAAHEAIPPSPAHDERSQHLVAEVRKTNIALAAAMEKASHWEWKGNALTMVFPSGYEAAVVKDEAESLRRAGESIKLPPFTVETRTEAPREGQQDQIGSRAELVRQVFRGQIMKG